MNYQEEIDAMISRLSQNKSYDIDLIKKAYEYAKRMHSGQLRKGGDEYIVHPVQVALTIEQMGLDANIICAALLHDTVEDCGYTLEQMKNDFNPLVSQIVDAVTEIKLSSKQKEEVEFPREEEDIQTYQKLISMGKTNKFAFYIKFADRLNNLRTIDCFKRYKQIEKVKQTERWLLPIIKLLKATKIYYLIKNECYKIIEKDLYNKFIDIYEKYNNQNEKYFNKLINNLKLNIDDYLIKKNNIKLNKIISEDVTPYELSLNLPNEIIISDFTFSKMNYFNKIATKKIYLIFNDSCTKKEIVDTFFELFNSNKISNNISLIGYSKDLVFANNYFILEDKIKNKYQCYLCNEKEYIELINGSSDGAEISAIDEKENNNLSSKFIKILTRSEEEILMPDNSTVLDFAFKLHKDLGFSCKYAHINESPNYSPIYTRLSNGDKVELVCEKNEETGMTMNIAKLRWLTYAHTEYAQRVLTKYFESLYE